MTYAVLHLKADIIIQMDADMSHDPKVLPQFIQKLKKEMISSWEADISPAVQYLLIGDFIEKFTA